MPSRPGLRTSPGEAALQFQFKCIESEAEVRDGERDEQEEMSQNRWKDNSCSPRRGPARGGLVNRAWACVIDPLRGVPTDVILIIKLQRNINCLVAGLVRVEWPSDPRQSTGWKGTRSTSTVANGDRRIPFYRVTPPCQIMRRIQRLANYLTSFPEVTVTTRWVTDGNSLHHPHMKEAQRTRRERDILNVNTVTCPIFHEDWENKVFAVVNWCLCWFPE